MSVKASASAPEMQGLGSVHATHASGASLTLCAHGGQLVSWRTADGMEQIFVSPDTLWAPPKAIRGGIPICFPQFSSLGPLPQHGFARNSTWRLADSCVTDAGTTVTMQLTKAMIEEQPEWPHDFDLRVSYTINAKSLHISANIAAPTEPIEAAILFHTYLRVHDIRQVRVEGLQGLRYRDATQTPQTFQIETRKVVTVDKPTDSVYLDHVAGRILQVYDPGAPAGRLLTIRNSNLSDCVVWNPWASGAESMADMSNEGFREFICVENGQTAPVSLAAGESWTASVTYETDASLDARL